MAEKDELGKILHERDLSREKGVDAAGVGGKNSGVSPKERSQGDVGVDADR